MARKKTPLPLLENVEITGAGAEGKAVARVNERVLFVPFAAPGDVVDVQVTRKKSSFYEGVITNMKKPSDLRIIPECEHFGLCGGCKWQHLDYENQKHFKQQQVKDSLDRIAKVPYPGINEIIGADRPFYYRNKLEFTFSDRRWLTEEDIKKQEEGPIDTHALGFHLPGKFDKILDIHRCYLQKDPSNAIRLSVKQFAVEQGLSFYNAREQQGLLRNLIIRTSSTGELMVVIIFGHEDEKNINLLMDFVGKKFPEITSLMYVVNTKQNDSIYDLEVKLFKGKDYLLEIMQAACEGQTPLKYKVGPKTFYQTNPEQAYKLYKTAHDFADFQGNEKVYDLYTGTGAIALFIARSVGQVIGIEAVDEAVEHAKKNAQENGISNVEFHCGDMAKLLDADFIAKHGRPDVIVTDPARAGMHQKVVKQILEAAPKKVVYVSCNPATQARDLALLDEKYEIKKVQPVDMFPQTHHVENVVLLHLKQL
ncbi:MAG: 23S rRNA (uracil(1939)-C(5))-methyltransferase RlmD [Bacteroidales bacterium]|nr:23S rRNA (uracil(1939)-C(5))-methyltransferase RlmD [Bacteroidales bacterium]